MYVSYRNAWPIVSGIHFQKVCVISCMLMAHLHHLSNCDVVRFSPGNSSTCHVHPSISDGLLCSEMTFWLLIGFNYSRSPWIIFLADSPMLFSVWCLKHKNHHNKFYKIKLSTPTRTSIIKYMWRFYSRNKVLLLTISNLHDLLAIYIHVKIF